MERWSGYETQSKAWQRGYDWGWHQGPHAELHSIEAAEAWGYDFMSPEEREFAKGIEFALGERGVEIED